MALQPFLGQIRLPAWPYGHAGVAGNFGITNALLNASADWLAIVVRIPKTGTLRNFHFRTGTVTTGDTVRVAFNDLDAAGHPDGTDDEFRDYVLGAGEDNNIISTGIISSDGTDIGTKRSVTVGDELAIVLKWSSYVSGNYNVSRITSAEWVGPPAVLTSVNSGSTWTGQAGCPICALEYDDGTCAYLESTGIFEGNVVTSVGSGSTPDEYALRFQVPGKVRVVGAFVQAASTDTDMTLYADGGSTLAGPATCALDGLTDDISRTYYFSSTVDLEPATWYRLSWKPTTATTRQTVIYDLPDADLRGTYPLGTNMMLSTRSDAGSWTDDTTKFMMAGLLVSHIEDGAVSTVSSPGILKPVTAGGHVIY